MAKKIKKQRPLSCLLRSLKDIVVTDIYHFTIIEGHGPGDLQLGGGTNSKLCSIAVASSLANGETKVAGLS